MGIKMALHALPCLLTGAGERASERARKAACPAPRVCGRVHAGWDRPGDGSGVAVPSPGTVWRAGQERGGEGRWERRATGGVRRCGGNGGGGGGVGGSSGGVWRTSETHTHTYAHPLSLFLSPPATQHQQYAVRSYRTLILPCLRG